MADMQKPTIGRIVHLCVYGRRVPAVVAWIDDEGLPDVVTLDGANIRKHHAEYAEESAESAAKPNHMDTPHYTWSWPPRTP